MSGPMDEIIRLAQEYKVAPIGPASEKALAALCLAVEKIYESALRQPTDPMAQRMREFFGSKW